MTTTYAVTDAFTGRIYWADIRTREEAMRLAAYALRGGFPDAHVVSVSWGWSTPAETEPEMECERPYREQPDWEGW